MPSLRIHRNGEHLCTAGSDDASTFSATVWGDVFGPEAAVLDISGSAQPPGAPGRLLVWECPAALARGDLLEMSFEAAGESLPGPVAVRRDAAGEITGPWSTSPTEAEIASLESREPLNAGATFDVRVADRLIRVAPDMSRQYVRLHVSWQERRPLHIRVSLSRKSLREIIARAEGDQLFAGDLRVGSGLVVAVAA